MRIAASTPDTSQRAAREAEMYLELLNNMIDERLEEQAAERAHVFVTPEELEQALQEVAAANGVSASSLVAEAKRQGLNEEDYRDELRRQILEGKMLTLNIGDHVRVTEQDARAAYVTWLRDEGSQPTVEVRILTMHPTGAGASHSAAGTERFALAQNLVARARAGEDFCNMVATYSDDVSTSATCGSRGPLRLSRLVPPVRTAIRTLKPNEVADPVALGTTTVDGDVLIVQLVSAARATASVLAYDTVKDQMMALAHGVAAERQRQIWLATLRRDVDVRDCVQLRRRPSVGASNGTATWSSTPAVDQRLVRLPLDHPAL
jgi:peptidyl-prolyl cis-trans isomerase SurA